VRNIVEIIAGSHIIDKVRLKTRRGDVNRRILSVNRRENASAGIQVGPGVQLDHQEIGRRWRIAPVDTDAVCDE
jgi:hypothetical protein